jgi:hypothetical protein
MNNAARIQSLHLTALSALDQAFESTTVAMARCCLETALSAAKQLAELGSIKPALVESVNETKMALAARGWS